MDELSDEIKLQKEGELREKVEELVEKLEETENALRELEQEFKTHSRNIANAHKN